MMRRCAVAAALIALALPATADEPAEIEPIDAPEICTGVADDRARLVACLDEVTAPCAEIRAEHGERAWTGCTAERALAWEAEVARRTLILRPTGHAEGKSGRAARWLATRQMQCRNPSKFADLTAKIGETAALGAVAQCELISNILRADQLGRLADALGTGADAAPEEAPLPTEGPDSEAESAREPPAPEAAPVPEESPAGSATPAPSEAPLPEAEPEREPPATADAPDAAPEAGE